MSGNSRYTADRIAANLNGDAICIKPEKAYPAKGPGLFLKGGKSAMSGDSPALAPYTFNAGDYDTVVFVFPVWAGRPAPPIKTFVEDNLESLAGKKIGVAACSGGPSPKTFERFRSMLGNFEPVAELNPVLPSSKPDPEKDRAIDEFCGKLM